MWIEGETILVDSLMEQFLIVSQERKAYKLNLGKSPT